MICAQLICAPKVFPTFGAQNFYRKKSAGKVWLKKESYSGTAYGKISPLLFFGMKKGAPFALPFAGAEKRIRTSGRVTPVTRFPIVLLKPLRHLCKTMIILQ